MEKGRLVLVEFGWDRLAEMAGDEFLLALVGL
jgi:hypothetical protein